MGFHDFNLHVVKMTLIQLILWMRQMLSRLQIASSFLMVLSNSLVAKNCTFFANFIVVYTVRDGPAEYGVRVVILQMCSYPHYRDTYQVVR